MTAGLVAAVWIGTFAPDRVQPACGDCAKPEIAPHAGVVRVLTPADDTPPASGDVLVVSPLLGVIVRGHVDQGRVAIPWFNFDRRDSADGVLVLPANAEPTLVTPTKLDVIGIEQAVLRDEVLAGVRRALIGLEIGAVDLDHDGKADLVVTYGCNAWADGGCQSHGQFFLVRRGAKWVEID
jgi:hypothetical protein